MDQTLTTRYVTRFEHLALHPRLHPRVGFSLSQLPPREPPPRRISYNSRSTELLSQQQPPHNRGVRPEANTTTNPHTSTEEAHNHTQSPLSKRDPKPTTQYNNLHLYQRGSNTRNQGFTTSGISQPQTSFLFLFPQNKDPNSLG